MISVPGPNNDDENLLVLLVSSYMARGVLRPIFVLLLGKFAGQVLVLMAVKGTCS